MWSNFHTHSDYCDGKMRPRDYLRAAREAGVGILGFSSHAPLPFPRKWSMQADALTRYLAEIDDLAKEWPDIQVCKGLEVDFIPGITSPSRFAGYLDYTIGSVHFVDGFRGEPWEIDNTLEIFREGVKNIFDNDVRAAVSRYLELTRQMVLSSPPDIIGHLDKIKIHNYPDAWFDESEGWYRNGMEKTLQIIRDAGIIVEVNTRGIYKKKSPSTYPSPWILERMHALRIPVTISSDAHHPDDLTREFRPVARTLREIGFRNLSILKKGIWQQVPFDEHGFEL